MTIHQVGAVFTAECSTRAAPFQIPLALLREGSAAGKAAARNKTVIDSEAPASCGAFFVESGRAIFLWMPDKEVAGKNLPRRARS